MEKFCRVSVPICIKIKKMYTNNEIEIIVDNCQDLAELYTVTACFSFLIANNYLKKSMYLQMKTHLRFRELEKL